jgi:cytochrome c-type biogenesis protein CcmH
MRAITRTALLLTMVAGSAAAAGTRTAPPEPRTAVAMQTERSQPQPAAQSDVVRETALDRQVKEVSAQLRCVVCQGLSIQDSPSTLAQEMRGVVREQLEAGRSPEQVKAYFVERYGEWVLLRPKASGFNLIVYLLPVFVIVGGAAFVFMKARSWTRIPTEAPGNTGEADRPPDSRYAGVDPHP